MSKNQISLKTSLFELCDLIASVSDAVAVIDNDGYILSQNQKYDDLPESVHEEILLTILKKQQIDSDFVLHGYPVRLVDLHAGTAIIVIQHSRPTDIKHISMASLQNDLNGSDDIFQSVALAMQESLKWKWIAITRFVDPERLEVLTFLENGQLLDNYEYDLIGTPCKTVMDTVKFTFFKDVVKAFPNYKALQSLGVKTYAGLVFKNSEGTPIGHVMAMHESDSVNIAHTQHVFEVATLTLSAHFKLSDANIKLAHARKQALLDQLTHVGNRLAFDTKLEAISMLNQRRKSDDFSVAVIDLDKLKPLNDTYGHEAGDRFIQLMAKGLEGLGRANDEVFRLGGDEFAIVFSQNIEPIRSSIEKRFQVLESKVSKALGFSIGASVGFAALSETKGNVKACLKLADERMYINKQKKKQLY